MIEFYDSNPGPFDSTPGHYPKGAQYAALYADTSLETGYHPQPNPGVPNVRFITRRGGDAAAVYAGLADFESGNVVYEGANLTFWAKGRANRNFRSRTYCNRSDIVRAHSMVGDLDSNFWWIATLDNNPHWTPQSIVDSIRAMHGINIPVNKVWAIQWGNGATTGWDTSTLFQDW